MTDDVQQAATSFWKKSVVFAELHPEWVLRAAFFIAGAALGHFWWR